MPHACPDPFESSETRDYRTPAINLALWRSPALAALLGASVKPAWLPAPDAAVWLGWGCKPSARRAAWYAARSGGSLLRLEDGFLRSWGTGKLYPALSLVMDDVGIYYDSTRPCRLENLLNSSADLLAGIADEVARAKALILEHRLSKYNHAPALAGDLPPARRRVLVVDQTAGDLSVSLGGANANTFADMLAAARVENPDAMLYVKTHPEVGAGSKRGYLTGIREDARTLVLREAINPLSLIEQMDQVYAVTSTLGFEALLAGKPVTLFGLPWYAGWGVTDDRQTCTRRIRARSVAELFAAAYFHYAVYLDPETHRRGTIFDVIDWLLRQRRAAEQCPGRRIAVGFSAIRRRVQSSLLGPDPAKISFAGNPTQLATLHPGPRDCLLYWGYPAPDWLRAGARRAQARLLHMEDGFIRSVGLGSDLVPPRSLVLDAGGLYFASDTASDLEAILANAVFTQDELERSRRVREFIVEHGITKYNLQPRRAPRWNNRGRRVLLVPGQVEDDASILQGCDKVRSNLALLRAARAACPDAYIVYKPHPDVLTGNRDGRGAMAQALDFADHLEIDISLINCIDACDEMHTMTSLSGFDALLRGKRVIVHGRPFYAGWGLTEDHLPIPRRNRRLSLDELVAGTLLRYPVYWDPLLQGYTTCEAVLRRILAQRNALEARGDLDKLMRGRFRRWLRKLGYLLHAR
jgi:capsular polysaccharide export protein